MSREQILAAIPHRDPFLLVDEIVEWTDSRIVCTKVFSGNEDFFAGHFPEFPIVPGVLMCEASMQCGAVLLSRHLEGAEGKVPVATRLNDVKPDMIEEATRNARDVAQKFADDSQSRLGKIRRASQGQFSIESRDTNNPHIKKVRVVSTVEYYLSD